MNCLSIMKKKLTDEASLFNFWIPIYIHAKLLRCSVVDQFQKILFPPENEVDGSAARVQKNSIHGTIWSMSFISKDPSQSSKGHSPVLAIILNRYDYCACLEIPKNCDFNAYMV